MAPATDSLQKDSYSRYRAEMEKGMGGHGRARGMKDEGGKSRDARFRLLLRGCIPPAYRDSYEFPGPRHLAGITLSTAVPLGRVSLSNFEITRPPHTSAFTLNSRQEIVVGLSDAAHWRPIACIRNNS